MPGSDRLVLDLPKTATAASLDWASTGQLSLFAAGPTKFILTFSEDGTILSRTPTDDFVEVLYSGGPDPQLLQFTDNARLSRVDAPNSEQAVPYRLPGGRAFALDVRTCLDPPA